MPSPQACALRTFVPARDFALSRRFYAALGWQVTELGPGLALVTLARAQEFYLQDYDVPAFAENCTLHVSVESAQAWYAHIDALLREGHFPGARVQPPARQPYGASVAFVHDPSGVLLHLCEWDG